MSERASDKRNYYVLCDHQSFDVKPGPIVICEYIILQINITCTVCVCCAQ